MNPRNRGRNRQAVKFENHAVTKLYDLLGERMSVIDIEKSQYPERLKELAAVEAEVMRWKTFLLTNYDLRESK